MGELSNIRIGRITSSDIVALTKKGTGKEEFGKPFYTYVEECRMERFFKQRLENSVEVLAMAWGKLCEKIVHNGLGFKYKFQSNITYEHPKYPEWCGTPDGTIPVEKTIDTITDIKCPLTRKAFFNLIIDLYDFDGINVVKRKNVDGNEIIKKIRARSIEGEKYYWQLVSNACILKANFAELIVFMPYFEELEKIREYNASLEEPFWLVGRAKDDELPFIYKESGIQNINVIRFEVPVEDKIFLEKRVKTAIELINE